ncbi:MAG: MG2 domain-containing protein [Acidobacteriota bacterium]
MRFLERFFLGASLLAACGTGSPIAHDPKPTSSTDTVIAGLKPTALVESKQLDSIDKAIATYFDAHQTRRTYIMTDKPLYQPGETIWLRADLRQTRSLVAADSWRAGTGLTLSLVSPRGAVIATKRVEAKEGVAANDFALSPDLEGGEYTIQLTSDDGATDAKKIIVNTYEAPRLQKTIEFVRKAYGEGDTVAAALEIKRATGEAFGEREVTGVVTVDDVEVARLPIKTDKEGKATAKFQLPAHIAAGDGLLTVMADDGGVVESIQKRIPIVLKKVQLSMYPEGGDLVEGVPGRVYFAAKNSLGKAADVAGRVVDDRGQVVASFASIHDGMGRFELVPSADRTYHVEIDKPAGIAQKFEVPAAKAGGCVVRAADPAQTDGPVRVAAICSSSRTLLVEATLREQRLAGGALDVTAGKPALVELPVDSAAEGAVRVTLFSTKKEPLAERLVYRNRGKDLKIELTADKKQYSPRDHVQLHVKTTDPSGKPVKASVGVAVVDDTVLTFADDKSAKILAHLYLDPELGATAQDPIEEPSYYFSQKPDAAAAMDALLATRGYRRFEWRPVLEPPPPPPPVDYTATTGAANMGMDEARAEAPMAAPPAPEPTPAPPRAHLAHAMHAPAGAAQGAKGGGFAGVDKVARAERKEDRPAKKAEMAKDADFKQPMQRRIAANDQLAAGDDNGEMVNGWSPVRVFPVPEYHKGYEGPRTDFRETIYWNPSVQTGSDGTAAVGFFVSDAVTSFRATAEGVSAGGVPGIGETVIQSKMPLSVDAHLPVEVTSGDEIRLPVTVTNETDDAVDATIDARFGAAFQLAGNPEGKLHLAAHDKTSLFYALRVVATDGDADVHLGVRALGLDDNLDKKIRVVPLGFPFEGSASGTAKTGTRAHHSIDLSGALPGSIHATVTMYPSPLASMTKGMEGMIREPGGCFEQTSSSNYPNVMIMAYLGANDAADTALIQKTQGTLDRGYKLLTGYETPNKGYEWFGHTPGHEALTAYVLMEFADMAKVYDVDHAMVERTADWLMSRRDGKGGFLRSQEALDSFGRASTQTTNAYIMWALSEAHRTKGLDKELAAQRELGSTTKDPYLLALAANTAVLEKDAAAPDMVKRLATMQDKDGSWTGAKESITMSGGESLQIETTSLATLALIKASPSNEYESQIRRAVDYLNAKRGGFGAWSNTQATILGLKAMTAYSEHSRQMQASGTATVIVNGKPAGTIAFEKGRKDALVFDDLASQLVPGKNTIELELAGGASLPYTIAIEYRAARPQSSAAAKVSVTTQLAKDHVKLGEGVKLHAHVENKTAAGIPMTLARIGIPGGTVFQTWQLKELRDKGLVDFYETRPREVILYWRAMAPNAKKDLDLDLLAQTPGTYEAPATSAYLYYTAEDKAWTAPVKVTIEK